MLTGGYGGAWEPILLVAVPLVESSGQVVFLRAHSRALRMDRTVAPTRFTILQELLSWFRSESMT
jgi:hypothetical protein